MPATSLEQIVSLAKRRGFVFPSSAVYGGLGQHLGSTVRSASS